MGLFDRFRAEQPAIESPVTEEDIAEAAARIVQDINPRGQMAEAIEALNDLQGQTQVRLRELEELGWNIISNSQLGLGPQSVLDASTRRMRNEAAERVWKEDPVAGRAVATINEYVWGRGLPRPRASDKRVQRLIRSFWEDEDNQLILTTFESQVRSGTDLMLWGEIFLVVFDDGSWSQDDLDPPTEIDTSELPPEEDKFNSPFLPPSENPTLGGVAPVPTQADVDMGDEEDLYSPLLRSENREPPPPPSAVKLGQIHPNEIRDVIPDEENAARPRFYKRVFNRRVYDYTEDTWNTEALVPREDAKPVTKYYEDLCYPPAEGQSSPPPGKIGEGKILHLAVNRHSFELRGNSELWRAVRWAKALNDFFTWRLTLLRALATFAFRKKVKGGSAQVIQAAQRMVAGTGYTGVPGMYDPVAPAAVGSVLTENQNETVEQFKTSSGAGEAEQDGQMLRGQVGVALGLPIHYLGDKGATSLAGAQAMELPVLKSMEARQELFEQLFTKILNFCIDKAIDDGALPQDVDRSFYVEMPNILQRNVPELVASLTNTIARLDPFAEDVKLKRLTLHQVLLWLGIPDPEAIVRDVYPKSLDNKPPTPAQVPGAPPGTPGGPPLPPDQGTPPDMSAGGMMQGGAAPAGGPGTGPLNGGGLGASGQFAGPEPLTGGQPYPGARSGNTLNGGGSGTRV